MHLQLAHGHHTEQHRFPIAAVTQLLVVVRLDGRQGIATLVLML
jgi:hypothetical protein